MTVTTDSMITELNMEWTYLYASCFKPSFQPWRCWSKRTRVKSLTWKTLGDPKINSNITTPTLHISYLLTWNEDKLTFFSIKSNKAQQKINHPDILPTNQMKERPKDSHKDANCLQKKIIIITKKYHKKI